TPITVSGGATVANVDFVLSPGGSISGNVFGLMPGETVNLQAYDALSGRYRGGFDSDAGFNYTIDSLPAGTYTLFAETGGTDRAIQWWDGHSRQNTADAVTLAADQDATGKDFVLAAGTSISGTVSLSPDPGDGGATVEQMWIEAFDPVSFEHVRGSSPDTAGSYDVDNLPPDSYALQVHAHQTGYVTELWVPGADTPGQPPVFDLDAATPIAVGVGTPATGVDFLLEEGRRIGGHVFLESLIENGVQDPGEPDIADAAVNVGLVAGGYGNGTRTDANGDYTVVGLIGGLYNVQVESGSVAEPFVTELWDDKTQFEVPDVVDVTVGDAFNIDFDVIQRQVVSGKVFLDFDDDQVQDAGEPGFTNVTVRATRVDGLHAGHAAVANDGSYSIGLLPGSYTLDAEPHQPGLLREHWNDVFFIEEAQPIDVTAADASGVDFGLIASTTVGTLRGRVIAGDTLLGIQDVGVEVWRFDNDAYVAGATTDADGDFSFSDLPPSSAAGYKVWFRTDASNDLHDSDYVSVFWSASGDPGSIDPDDLRVVFPTLPDPPGGPGTDLGSFELALGGSISGTVFPPGGESLPENMTVSAQSFESGGAPLPGASVDGGGAYRIRGLPAPATYRVQADTYGTDLVPVFFLTAAESTFDHSTAAPVDVAVDLETAGIDLHLFVGGSISGTVTRDAAATPVGNFQVSAHLADDPLGRGFWAGINTELDGTYQMRGLPSGSYEVRTDGRDADLANEIFPSLVTVSAPAETAGIDFALAAAGRIRGRVTQTVAMITEPVVNIRVEATDFATGQFLSDGFTDAVGDYVIGALPQGRDYRLRVATQDGNDPQFFNFIGEYYDDQLLYETADAVSVPVDPGGEVTEVTGIDFELALGGAISGLVTDGSGSPLQSVWVHADDFAGTSFGNGDLTDQNGFYVVRGLAPGSYRVRADPYPQDFVSKYFDDTYDYNLATSVSVAAVPEGGPIPITADINFALADAFTVSGVVTEDDGTTPIAGLPMSANGIDVATGGGASTLADGSYEIRGLPAGRYQVVTETDGTSFIRQQQEVDLSAGSVSGVDFALEAGASISGRAYEDTIANGVYDPGEEQADVAVTAFDFFTGEWIASATSGADGSYQIQGLDAGSYRVETEPDDRNFVRQYWDGVFRHDQATPVEIVDGAFVDVAGIDFPLVRGFEIRGLVFFDPNDDGIRQGGEPAVGNVHVNADHNDQPINAWGNVEADGTYVLHGVFPGQYRVYAHAQGTPYASELYRLVGGLPVGTFRYSEADLVDVNAGDAAGIDISLVLGGGVTGTVRDAATAMALANVDVNASVFDEDGLGAGNRSGSDGRYLIDGLPPGGYRLSTYDSQGIYVGEYHQDAL
ncbi:MAG: carboxypeptidase regulatory-like domain-containing protein, partial [Thermoanaerobaculia bacterium]